MPLSPKNFRATPLSTTSVGFAISPDDDLTRVQRKIGTAWRDVASIEKGKTSAEETGLTANTKYAYRARAVNGRGEKSTPTDVVYATTLKPGIPVEPPAPNPVTDLHVHAFDAALGKLNLKYTYDPAGGKYTLVKNGVDTVIVDTNGDLFTPHGGPAAYTVRDVRGIVSNALLVMADGKPLGPDPEPTPEPEPTPVPQPAPGIPADAVYVGASHALKTLDDLNNAMQPGKTYVIEGRHTYRDSSGVEAHKAGCTFIGKDAIIESEGDVYEYPRAFDVTAADVTIGGFDLRGPSKAVGVQVNDGATGCTVHHLTAPKGELGTGVDAKRAVKFTMADCTFPGLRRYGLYGKVYGGTFRNLTIGPSLGGTYKGNAFGSEHGLRYEKYSDVDVIDCDLSEPKKSGLNAKTGDGLRITRGTYAVIGLGPLGDGDGLKHKDDPAQIARGIVLDSVMVTKHLTLEMNVDGMRATGCTIEKVDVVKDARYPARQIASGTFVGCRVSECNGDRSRLEVR